MYFEDNISLFCPISKSHHPSKIQIHIHYRKLPTFLDKSIDVAKIWILFCSSSLILCVRWQTFVYKSEEEKNDIAVIQYCIKLSPLSIYRDENSVLYTFSKTPPICLIPITREVLDIYNNRSLQTMGVKSLCDPMSNRKFIAVTWYHTSRL